MNGIRMKYRLRSRGRDQVKLRLGLSCVMYKPPAGQYSSPRPMGCGLVRSQPWFLVLCSFREKRNLRGHSGRTPTDKTVSFQQEKL
jgi:hypothetical protein